MSLMKPVKKYNLLRGEGEGKEIVQLEKVYQKLCEVMYSWFSVITGKEYHLFIG